MTAATPPAASPQPTRVMISCGEASGDLYAAALTRALRASRPGIDVFGFGGDRLQEAGADLIGTYRGLTVTGLVEALRVLPRSWQMLKALEAAAAQRKPDVFVAIDFPDFNFRLLPAMQRLGIPVVYYISPQLWAWRPGRLATIRRYVKKMLVIFPFESAIYENAGVPVEFVGHPLLELTSPSQPRESFLRSVGLAPERPVVALLPGSRPNELSHILPTLVDAVPRIAAGVPGVQCVVARAPALDDRWFAPLDRLRAAGIPLAVAEGVTDDVLSSADAAITASGTATVQTALHGCPMVIVYRLSGLTYAIGRAFVKLQTYGMVNLVAGRTIVTELIQDAMTPDAVARETISLLTDRARVDRMRHDLADVRSRLGGPGASARAAAAVLALH
jgi:lipid-A-disaccharide synthase